MNLPVRAEQLTARLVVSFPSVSTEAAQVALLRNAVGTVDRLAASGLGVRLVMASSGAFISPIVGSEASSSVSEWEKLTQGFLSTVPAEPQQWQKAALRVWRSGRRITRYALRSTAAAPVVSLRDAHLDLLRAAVGDGDGLVVVDLAPAISKVQRTSRRFGLETSAADSSDWSLAITTICTDSLRSDELERLLFENSHSVRFRQSVPTSHGEGERWVADLLAGMAWVRPTGLLTSAVAAQFLTVPPPQQRTGASSKSHPIGLISDSSMAGSSGLDDLAGEARFRHTLITGDPGTGKSTALQRWLINASRDSTITVVDPTKKADEYELLRTAGFDIIDVATMLPLNPLLPPLGVRVAQYSDLVVRAIDESTGLGDKFPLGTSILRNAVHAAYDAPNVDGRPGLADVIREVYDRVASMAQRSTQDAQIARESVTERLIDVSDSQGEGSLCGDGYSELPWRELRDRNVVLLLHGLGSRERRTLVSMLAVAGVTQSQAQLGGDQSRLLVLEEAHNFFPRSNGGRSASGIMQELLGDAVAELRSSRIGLVFVDQLPSGLPAAIRSICGNVVAFRSSDRDEADVIGSKLNLGESSSNPLVELADYQAYVRLVAEPVARLRVFGSSVVGNAGRSSLPPAVPGRLRMAWCIGCPSPCKGFFALQHSLDSAVRLRAADTSREELRRVVGAAAAVVGETGRVAGFAPFGDIQPSERQLAGAYCVAAYAVACDSELTASQRRAGLRAIEDWTRRGEI